MRGEQLGRFSPKGNSGGILFHLSRSIPGTSWDPKGTLLKVYNLSFLNVLETSMEAVKERLRSLAPSPRSSADWPRSNWGLSCSNFIGREVIPKFYVHLGKLRALREDSNRATK